MQIRKYIWSCKDCSGLLEDLGRAYVSDKSWSLSFIFTVDLCLLSVLLKLSRQRIHGGIILNYMLRRKRFFFLSVKFILKIQVKFSNVRIKLMVQFMLSLCIIYNFLFFHLLGFIIWKYNVIWKCNYKLHRTQVALA